MRIVVLTGDDILALRQRREQLLAEVGVTSSDVERFDVAADGGSCLVQAAGAMSLFAGPRLLEAADAGQLTPSTAAALGRADGDAVVLLRSAAALPAAVRKGLGETVEVISCRVPSGKGVAVRLEELARAAGVELDGAGRAVLAQRAGHDIARAGSVLQQLAAVGLTRPRADQVATLLGSSAAPDVPWALSDALECGDLSAAVTCAAGLEPVAVVAYLSSRAVQAGRVVEEGLSGDAEVAAALGLSGPFPARKLAALARRLGPAGVAASVALLAAADRQVKVGRDPRAAVDLLLAALVTRWGRTAPATSGAAGLPWASPLRSPLPC